MKFVSISTQRPALITDTCVVWGEMEATENKRAAVLEVGILLRYAAQV